VILEVQEALRFVPGQHAFIVSTKSSNARAGGFCEA
jgi:hypothetical protein